MPSWYTRRYRRRNEAGGMEKAVCHAGRRRANGRFILAAASRAPAFRSLHRAKSMVTIMDDKIGLEEHFATDDTLLDSKGYLPDRTWAELSRRLLDVADLRLAEMDRNGIAVMILSLNAPAIQAIPDARRAD